MPTLSALRRSKLPFFSHAAEDNHPGAGVPDEAKPFLDSGLESSSPTEETFATEADDDNKLATKGGVPRRRVGYLIALNISIAGLAFAFSIQLAESTQFLSSIGVSPTVTSLIWLVPPLCGSLLQPCFGAWSDATTISFGQRRPFIAGGGFGLALSLLGFSWSEDIAALLFSNCRTRAIAVVGEGRVDSSSCLATQLIATFFLVAINVCIQPLQNGLRALLVDNCPAEQQTEGNAWGSRVAHVSNCVLYVFAYMDLPKSMPFLGGSQLKSLSTITIVTLGCTIAITCAVVKERQPRGSMGHDQRRPSILDQAAKAFGSLTKYLRRVFAVQFICWFAWFPFMVYITSHISEAYYRSFLRTDPDHSPSKLLSLRASASRSAALSLLGLSLVGLVTSLLLPPFYHHFSTPPQRRRFPPSMTSEHQNNSHKLSQRFNIHIPGLTLRRIWMATQTIYALCSFGILAVKEPLGKVVVASIVGVNWGVLTWVPAALVNMEILRMKREISDGAAIRLSITSGESGGTDIDEDSDDNSLTAANERFVANGSEGSSRSQSAEALKDISGDGLDKGKGAIAPSHHRARSSRRDFGQDGDDDDDDEDEQSGTVGTVLGINNVYIAAPQIIGLLACSAIIWFFGRTSGVSAEGRSSDDGGMAAAGTGWVIGLGGLASLGAVALLWSVEEREGK